MRVCTSSRVIHNDVFAGLKFMAEDQEDCEDYETTAWFLEVLFKWYNLMASRSPGTALSLKNELRYNDSIDFLEDLYLYLIVYSVIVQFIQCFNQFCMFILRKREPTVFLFGPVKNRQTFQPFSINRHVAAPFSICSLFPDCNFRFHCFFGRDNTNHEKNHDW